MPAPKGNKFAKGNKGGPGNVSKYRPEYPAIARKACEVGFTDKELAALFKVSETAIGSWKLEHEEFAEALKAGKAPADDRVERCLYHRAVGYSFDSVKIFQFQGKPVVVPYVEHVPPDVTAGIFWLKNRRRDEWRDRTEVKHEIDTGLADELDRLKALNHGAGDAK